MLTFTIPCKSWWRTSSKYILPMDERARHRHAISFVIGGSQWKEGVDRAPRSQFAHHHRGAISLCQLCNCCPPSLSSPDRES